MARRAIATLILALAFATNAVAEKVLVGTEAAYEPFAFKTADGELVGFDIDFTYALCEEMKVECEIIEQDWDGLIPGLLAKKYDVIIASMSITEERMKVIDFAGPYYRAPSRFFALKGSGLTDAQDSLAGRKIGVLRASTLEKFVKKHYPDADLRTYPSQEEVYLDLAARRLEVGFAAALTVELGFLNKEAGKDFEFIGGTHYDEELFGVGTGIALRQGNDALRERMNAAIKAIRENGVYKKINDKYFTVDIYPF